MNRIEKMHGQARELARLLRLQSMPIALKMVTDEGQIPPNALRPVRDRGHHLSFCQALAWTRRKGLAIAETREDMWCFEEAEKPRLLNVTSICGFMPGFV